MNTVLDIPAYQWDSIEVVNMIKSNLPVIMLNCPLTKLLTNKWNFDYLSTIISDDFLCDVYTVECGVNEPPIYNYWDTTKNMNKYKFEPPSKKLSMNFREFLNRSSAIEMTPEGKCLKFYLQQGLVQGMGQTITDEYTQFSLETALQFKLAGNWDEFTTNLLLCGPPGATTTSHFDEQQNLFAQLSGVKRVRLHAPSDWHRLYPFPYGHPRDRQARVVLPRDGITDENTNQYFPAFQDAVEYRVDLVAGQVLFVPQYWWHQMEGLTQNVSLSWWFKDSGLKGQLDTNNLKVSQKLAIRRNVEKILGESVGGGHNAHYFFLAIAGGRLLIPDVPDYATASPPLILLPEDVRAAENINIIPEWENVLKQSIVLISHVMPVPEIPYFLIELVSGRFANLELSEE